jgi:hypothetical protein
VPKSFLGKYFDTRTQGVKQILCIFKNPNLIYLVEKRENWWTFLRACNENSDFIKF